jgi:molybdopterin-containing oxidoreductase family iron-sulfur binding subunit
MGRDKITIEPLPDDWPSRSQAGNAPRGAEQLGVRDMVIRMLDKHQIDDVQPERIPHDGQALEWNEIKDIFNLSDEVVDASFEDDVEQSKVLTLDGLQQLLNKQVSRRDAIKLMAIGLVTGLGFLQAACTPGPLNLVDREKSRLKLDEYFKGNYRLMTDEEKKATIARLERLYELETGKRPVISGQGPQPGVLYGYAFNISKCRGYLECAKACVLENNQDRSTDIRYIRIHEMPAGSFSMERATDDFYHEVPAANHLYVGTQCFHCENPPCVDVCPVQATWKEDDGIVVIDYDWCIGCRYCQAACPYDGRRFNWKSPSVPTDEINLKQHYLGNRLRKKGVMEKCTFCIQRTREGQMPACVEACPTGARIFGNLLDPDSEIRWVLENKKVFRLKEDLGTEPKFWYFMD